MGGTTTCPVCKSTTPLMETYLRRVRVSARRPRPPKACEVPQEEAPAAELIAEADGQRHKLRQGVNTLGTAGNGYSGQRGDRSPAFTPASPSKATRSRWRTWAARTEPKWATGASAPTSPRPPRPEPRCASATGARCSKWADCRPARNDGRERSRYTDGRQSDRRHACR